MVCEHFLAMSKEAASERRSNNSSSQNSNRGGRPKVSHYIHPRQQGSRGRGRSRGNGKGGQRRSYGRGRGRGHGQYNQHNAAPSPPLDFYPGEDFFGTGSLISQLDKKVIVILLDHQHIVGVLRSFDQFGNFVLQHACRRFYEGNNFCDIPLGLYIIRGEQVVLLGELDAEKDENGVEGGLVRLDAEAFKKLRAAAAAK